MPCSIPPVSVRSTLCGEVIQGIPDSNGTQAALKQVPGQNIKCFSFTIRPPDWSGPIVFHLMFQDEFQRLELKIEAFQTRDHDRVSAFLPEWKAALSESGIRVDRMQAFLTDLGALLDRTA